MFQFLQAGWLWFAASMALPLALHFWNRKPPKIVYVGSIQFIKAAQNQQLNRFSFAQPWLLLLRCLLLLLLALVLAGLHWKREITAPPQKHVYLHPALLQPPYLSQISGRVDSLAAQGWRVHQLQPGFPEIPLSAETSIADFAQSAPALDDTPNAWSLLGTLDKSLPAQAQAQIFSTDLLRHHRGPLPEMRHTFHWVPVSAPQKETWLQDAFYTQDGQLNFRYGSADGDDVSFPVQKIPKPTANQTIALPGYPALRFSVHAQADSLVMEGKPNSGLALTKQPLRVLARYAKNRQTDVTYLRAALQTALEYHGVAFQLTISPENQPLPATAPHWVFWLSDEPLAPFLARFSKNRPNTLQDAPTSSSVKKEKTWLQIPGQPEHVAVRRRINSSLVKPGAEVVWQDGFGQPMLTLQTTPGQRQYQFYSRFHPAWNDLPDNGNFPELLLRLLFPENLAWEKIHDTRSLPQHAQTPKQFSASFLKNSPKTTQLLDLKPWLLALLALLLALERWLASRTLQTA